MEQQRRYRGHSSVMAAAGSVRLGRRGHLRLGRGLTQKTTWGACCWLTICSLSVAMALESSNQESEAPTLCMNNCGFYGSSMTNNMCSKCYKDFVKLEASKRRDDPLAATAGDGKEAEAAAQKKPASNRCLTCGKKVGLTGFQCRCGGTFCSTHRYADAHRCTFDYKAAAREQIAKENPVVVTDKINRI